MKIDDAIHHVDMMKCVQILKKSEHLGLLQEEMPAELSFFKNYFMLSMIVLIRFILASKYAADSADGMKFGMKKDFF